jgi:hypothetical protein
MASKTKCMTPIESHDTLKLYTFSVGPVRSSMQNLELLKCEEEKCRRLFSNHVRGTKRVHIYNIVVQKYNRLHEDFEGLSLQERYRIQSSSAKLASHHSAIAAHHSALAAHPFYKVTNIRQTRFSPHHSLC